MNKKMPGPAEWWQYIGLMLIAVGSVMLNEGLDQASRLLIYPGMISMVVGAILVFRKEDNK
jgi:hypothetical protein